MQQLSLVSVELRPVTAGWRNAARELDATHRLVSEVGAGTIGTPTCDPSVEAALHDLASVLGWLASTAGACALALGRHDEGGPS